MCPEYSTIHYKPSKSYIAVTEYSIRALAGSYLYFNDIYLAKSYPARMGITRLSLRKCIRPSSQASNLSNSIVYTINTELKIGYIINTGIAFLQCYSSTRFRRFRENKMSITFDTAFENRANVSRVQHHPLLAIKILHSSHGIIYLE